MFKVFVHYPSFDEEFEVARRTTATLADTIEPVLTAAEILELQRIVREVPVSDHVIRYALALVRQTRVREAGRARLRRRPAELGRRAAGGAVPDPRREGPGAVAGPHARHLRRRPGAGQAGACGTAWC